MRHRRHKGLVAALSLLAGGFALVAVAQPSGAVSDQVCMGIVIDEGNGTATVPQAAEVTPATTTDLDALSMAGDTVTQNDSGLVCGINDYPANALANCLSASNGLFYYWSYWEGNPTTNTWTYANIGPASHTLSSGQEYVEGWRYQDPGADNPNAVKPSVTPKKAFAQACANTKPGGGGSGGSTTTSSVPAPTSSTPPPPHAASGTTSPTTPRGTHAVSSATSTTLAVKEAVGPGPPATSACASTTTSTTLLSKGTAGSSPPTGSSSTTTRAASPCGTTTSTTAAGFGRLSAERPQPTKVAAADTSKRGTPGGDSALPIILIGAVILLLGGTAWFRWRRRPAEE